MPRSRGREGPAEGGSRRARSPAASSPRGARSPRRPRSRAGARTRTPCAASPGRRRSLDPLELLADDGDLFHEDLVGAGLERAHGDLGGPGVQEVVAPDLAVVVVVEHDGTVLAGVSDLALVDLLVPV